MQVITLSLIFVVVGIFLSFATKKKWIIWKGGSPIASITAFHDFQTNDKQNAIEYVMEEKAGKKMEEQTSGDGM